MSTKLKALWFIYRWLFVKALVPFIMFLFCLFLFWIPQLQRSRQLQQEQLALQTAIQNQASFRHDVDSLRTDLASLMQLHAGLSSYSKATVPILDSLRRSAEGSGLTVTDLAEFAGNAGFSSIYRFELEGTYPLLLAWVDSLAALHPNLQLVRMHWSANTQVGMHRLSGLELGRWDFHVRDTSHSSVATWITRARSRFSNASFTSKTLLVPQDPFQGPQPPRVMQKVVVATIKQEPPKPLVPAPKLSIIGLVGGRLATVNTEKGERLLLRVGDSLGEWTVESISNVGFVLRNQNEIQTYKVR